MSSRRCRAARSSTAVLVVVEPPALVVAQRPQRRDGHPAGEPGVRLEDPGHRGPGEDVLDVLAALELHGILLEPGEVDVRAVAVVDERRTHRPRRQALVVEERDGQVVRVVLGARAVRARVGRVEAGGELQAEVRVEDVGVPVGEGAAAPVEPAGLLAQAEERVLLAAAAPEGEGVVQRRVRPRPARLVGGGLEDRRAVRPADVDPERVEPEGEHEPVRAEGDRPGPVVAAHGERRLAPPAGPRTRHTSGGPRRPRRG